MSQVLDVQKMNKCISLIWRENSEKKYQKGLKIKISFKYSVVHGSATLKMFFSMFFQINTLLFVSWPVICKSSQSSILNHISMCDLKHYWCSTYRCFEYHWYITKFMQKKSSNILSLLIRHSTTNWLFFFEIKKNETSTE